MQTNTAVIRTENRSTDPIERALLERPIGTTHWNDPLERPIGTTHWNEPIGTTHIWNDKEPVFVGQFIVVDALLNNRSITQSAKSRPKNAVPAMSDGNM